MVPAGHEVAWAQFAMPGRAGGAAARGAAGRSPSNARAKRRGVERDGFSVSIDAETGMLTSVRDGSGELLAHPMEPHFWRAPVDNDRGQPDAEPSGRVARRRPSWSCEGSMSRLGGQRRGPTARGCSPRVDAPYT
jgi:beta-galactosidase